MRVLYLTDRLSTRGGADQHLRQVVEWAVEAGHQVAFACGRVEEGAVPVPGVALHRVRGLASPVASEARLSALDGLLGDADLVHLQNVMNPVAIRRAVATGLAVVTVQDHRMFCPASGKTLPDGSPCRVVMHETACRECVAEPDYLHRTLALTRDRLRALDGARVVVLSRYMAAELAAVGVTGAAVIPPWVEAATPRDESGEAVLMGGRLVAHKGVVDGWRAWEGAGRPLPLRVAGEGLLGAELPGSERLGWLGPEALRRELRRARVLLFPAAWQEPFGILGVEALAAGTPVIVADVGGTREWSDAGCVRVSAGDTSAMAAAIGRLAAEPATSVDLGERGRRAVGERFSRRRVVPLLEELYRRATERRPVERSPAQRGGTPSA